MNTISVKLFEYLKKAGIPEDLAQKTSIELPEFLGDSNKHSVEILNSKIIELDKKIDKTSLEQDNKINKLDFEQTNKIDKLEARLNSRIDNLGSRIDRLEDKINHLDKQTQTKFNLLVGMFVMLVAGIIAILLK
ncbi:MAG: hypothetical protein LBQ34_00175 [Alphaproteobacteria bacterium]|jgi:TolA-binding protein|nr:hypothetical protein [Alphaproteobacteria bacterium]